MAIVKFTVDGKPVSVSADPNSGTSRSATSWT